MNLRLVVAGIALLVVVAAVLILYNVNQPMYVGRG